MDLEGNSPAEVAAWLMEEHRAGRRFVPFADRAFDASLAGAYAIQRAYMRLERQARRTRVAGWKIGLTSPTMQQLCGIDSPVAGELLDDRLAALGAVLRLADYSRLGVEFEIAVRLGRDLSAREGPLTPEEVAAAVDAVAPAVEVVDDRGCDYTKLDVFSLVADNAWNAGAVLGPWRSQWRELAEVQGVVHQDGREVARGLGSDVLGHPFRPLAWLAQHLSATGEGLRAGEIIMTGSLVRTRFPEGPQTLRYEVSGLGSVDLRIAE